MLNFQNLGLVILYTNMLNLYQIYLRQYTSILSFLDGHHEINLYSPLRMQGVYLVVKKRFHRLFTKEKKKEEGKKRSLLSFCFLT